MQKKYWSLNRSAVFMVAAMFVILLLEYFFIRYKIEALEDVEEKKDYARGAQLAGQQIAILVQQHLKGDENLTARIGAMIDEQNHILEVLSEGGRIDGTDVFLSPLSRLPRISFEELRQAWNRYRENIMYVILEKEIEPVYDSSSMEYVVSPKERAVMLLPAQWLTLSNWYQKLETDLTEEAEQKKETVESLVLFFIILDFILLSVVYILFRTFVIRPLKMLHEDTQQRTKNEHFPKNEIGDLTGEVNEILEQLKDATEFVGTIGEGKLNFDYRLLDEGYTSGENKLADSLIAMQTKLKDMSVDEQRRNWANEGLTKFVDILRSSNDNMSQLGDRIISALVQYTGSNQGGLYLLNDDERDNEFLELIALFAFHSKKFETQKIRLGEGILGQTFLERETTLLTELPEEYIRITSGLGDATPKSLLLVPLKVDQDVYGIVELASFAPYDNHVIAFVEKLAETIASTLASVKAAQKNRQLIEQFQQQTEEMRAQEEEMRQNMEELQATQEEMARKERDYISKISNLERAVEKANADSIDSDDSRRAFEVKERELLARVAELEKRPVQKGNDWALAEEMEKTLRFQLEALRITQHELSTK